MHAAVEAALKAVTNAGGLLEGHLAAAGLPKVWGVTLRDMLRSLNRHRAADLLATTVGLSAILIAVAIGLLSVLYLVWGAVKRSVSGGQKEVFPGPRRYPLVGNLFELLRNIGRTYDWMVESLASADSSWILLTFPGAKWLVVTDPRDVEHMLKTNFDNYPKGPEIHDMLYELIGNGIFNADGETWRVQRKAASHEFSKSSLKDLMLTVFNTKVDGALVPLIERFAEKGTPFDLQDLFQRCTFDTICSIGFGVDTGCLAPDLPIVPFAAAFDIAQETLSRRFLAPPIVYKVRRFLGLGLEKKLTEAMKEVDSFAYDVIRRRRQEMAGPSPKKHEDLLSRFIAVADQETKSPGASEPESEGISSTSDRYLRDMTLNFVLAGRDTTSATLSWFFWVLTQHRDVEEKIVEEVDRIAAAKGGSGPFDFEDLRSMTYLQAALSETLRLYPAVPNNLKSALSDDTFPSGARVRAGWRIGYVPYAQGRRTSVWGPDALEFKPERWFDSAGHYVQQSPYKFPSFQAGPRICLGKDMAYLQMKVVAASLLRRFKFTVVPDHVVTYRQTFVLTMKDGLEVIVEQRRRVF